MAKGITWQCWITCGWIALGSLWLKLKQELKLRQQDFETLGTNWCAKKSYSDTVAQFEKKSGYKVDMVEMEDPNAQENLTKDASTAADVFSLPHDQLGKLVDAGAIQEIPEQYSKEIAEQDTEQAAVGAQYKGKTYAFPYGIETQVTYYNKSKLN